MTSTTVNKYKIYCNTESAYVNGWGQTAPTTCYNNNAHDVNAASVQLIQTVSQDAVTIKQDTIAIARNPFVRNIVISGVAPNSSESVTYIFNIPSSMYSFYFITTDAQMGDTMSVVANSHTTMGLITANITAGTTVIPSPAAMMLYGALGFYFTITDGTHTEELGQIISKDLVANTVTVQTATAYAYSATNTLVQFSVVVADAIVLGGGGMHSYFDNVIGGAAIPAGTVTTYTYTNNSSTGPDKMISMYMNCLC